MDPYSLLVGVWTDSSAVETSVKHSEKFSKI